MSLFGGGGETVTTTFVAKDDMTPVVRGIRNTMDKFKRDASTGFGLAGGISVFNSAERALGMVVDTIGDATRAYREDQLSQAQLRTALEANIDAWNGNTDAIEETLAARMKLGFSDDEQRASLALLVAQVKDVNAALAIQRTAMDLARLKGTSLADSATLLAKAYNGSATGLNKMGIKLRAGAKGMEAIAAVQERVAGQAETWAEQSANAAAILDVRVGELQESLGRLIDGPAMLFTEFLSGVVDVLDGPEGANKQVGDMADRILSLYDAAAIGARVDPFAKMATGIQKAHDEMQQLEYFIADPYRQAVLDLGDVTRYALGASVDYLGKLADAAARTGFQFRFLVDEAISTKAATNILTGAWTGAAAAIEGAGETVTISLHTLPAETMHAVVGMKRAIKDGKAGIVEQFRQLAWQSKHPFALVNYENWLEKRQAAAARKMKAAAKAGRPDVVEQYRQLVQDIHDELDGLPGYADGIAADAMAQLAGIGPAVTSIMNGGLGGVEIADPLKPRKGKGRHHRKRAMGGPVDAGGTYLVGENGPELLHMGRGSGNVTPNHRMGGGVTQVFIDGRKLFEIMDDRQGRAIAMGG